MRKLFTVAVLLFSLLFPVTVKANNIRIPIRANKYKRQLIREARAHFGLSAPVSLFAAQIHQESLWRTDARSYVGATGLSQFMPKTASWMAKIYPNQLGSARPLDANWSIRAMLLYDKWLYKRTDSFIEDDWNRWGAVLSSYNGGLGTLRKDARLSANHCDISIWWDCVEKRSNRKQSHFEENRGYVFRIIRIIMPEYAKNGWT